MLQGPDPTDGVHRRRQRHPRPTSAGSVTTPDGRRAATPAGHRTARRGAREARAPSPTPAGRRPGWIVKIVLLGLADALAIAGLLIAFDEEAWGYAAVLGVTLVALNVVYLPRRYVPMKYLLPGLFFLPCSASTRCCTRRTSRRRTTAPASCCPRTRRSSRSRASRSARSRGRRRTTSRRCRTRRRVRRLRPLRPRDRGALPRHDRRAGAARGPAELQVLTTTGRTFIVSVGDFDGVRPGDLDTLPGYPGRPGAYVIPGATEGSAIRISGGQAFESEPHRVYDAENGTITDTETGTVYTADRGPVHRARRARRSTPGFTTERRLRQLPRGASPASEFQRLVLRACWSGTSPSPLFGGRRAFALGLLLAMVFNDERMRGRKLYRSLMIIPYALPSVHDGAGVARACSTRRSASTAGSAPTSAGWRRRGWRCSRSSSSTSGSATRTCSWSARARCRASRPTSRRPPTSTAPPGSTTFRKITFPLLLTAVSPLLVASFAFNFNNFTIVYLVTGGGPRDSGETRRSTDILLSRGRTASPSTASPSARGSPPPLSVLIFIIVAVLSAIGFKYTKTFEEVR